MDRERPFSGPVSVRLAGLTIVVLGAASFASGLSHQLRVSRPGIPTQMRLAQPNPAPRPPAPIVTAEAAPLPPEPAPKPAQPQRHRSRHGGSVPTLPNVEPAAPPAEEAAPSDGVDAVATAPADETPPASAPSPDAATAAPP